MNLDAEDYIWGRVGVCEDACVTLRLDKGPPSICVRPRSLALEGP